MKHLKSYKLFESSNISQLEEISTKILNYLNSKYNKEALKDDIYHYLVHDKDAFSQVSKLFSKPGAKEKWSKWWEELKRQLQVKSSWDQSDNPGWFQLKKPGSKINTGDGKKSDNYKEYLTFPKDNTFYKNYEKIGLLIKELNNKNLKGTLSLKIPYTFSAAWSHHDNVVIHFSDAEDKSQIQDAYKSVGFNLMDRKNINRVDSGKDLGDESDSKIISSKILDNIDNNKDILKKYLSSQNIEEKKKGLSSIDHIIKTVSMKSSHRN